MPYLGLADVPATRPSDEERRRQLDVVARLAAEIAGVFGLNGDRWSSEAYASLAQAATSLLANGFAQADLNLVSSLMPSEPYWLDSRMPAYNVVRTSWQDQVAPLVHDCQRAASDLRTIGNA